MIGDSIVVVRSGGSTRPADAPDREVHLFDARTGAFLRGIGHESEQRDGPRRVTGIAASGDGSIWLMQTRSKTMERWSLADERIATLTWSADWFHHADASFRSIAPATGPVPAMAWEDPPSGRLWVATVVRDPAYEEPPVALVPGAPLPTGHLEPAQVNARYRTLISVVDLRRGQVIAHRVLDPYVYQFLADGRVVTMHEADDGLQWIEVLTLELVE